MRRYWDTMGDDVWGAYGFYYVISLADGSWWPSGGEIRMGRSGEENTAATARRGLFEASWKLKEVLPNEGNSADTSGSKNYASVKNIMQPVSRGRLRM